MSLSPRPPTESCNSVHELIPPAPPQSRTVSSRTPRPLPPATGLIFHMHGGGYVAQSPNSHEVRAIIVYTHNIIIAKEE